MSYGILESINTKNRLYKRFIQTDKNNVALFDTLKAEYHIYHARLRRTIREVKRMFYARTFLLYKNDMRKTLLLYTTFVKRIIHKLTCSNALSIQ